MKVLLKEEHRYLLQVNYTGQLFPLKWGIGKIICDVVRSGGRWAALRCTAAGASLHSTGHWRLCIVLVLAGAESGTLWCCSGGTT